MFSSEIHDLNLLAACFTTLQFFLPLFLLHLSFFEYLVFIEVLLSLVHFV